MTDQNTNDFNLNLNTFIACLFFRKNKDNQIEMLTVRRPEDGGASWNIPQGKIDIADFLDCDPDRIDDRSILKTFLKNHFKAAVDVDFDRSSLEIIKHGDYMLVCSVAEVDRNPMIVDKMDLMYDIDLEKEEQSLLSSSQQAPESHWADVWDFMGNNAEVLQSNMLDAIIKLLQKTD